MSQRLVVVIAVLAFFAAFGSTAYAAPLDESEPNVSEAFANGPIPADGLIASYGTSNDRDFAFVNLNPQSQVTISVTYVSGCNPGITYPAEWGVEAIDVLGRSRLKTGFTAAGSFSWTSPSEAVRLNFGFLKANKLGCTILFQAQPGSAILNGPLPAPPPRTLGIAPLNVMVAGRASSVTLAGDAIDGDKVTAKFVPVSEGVCPKADAYPDDSSSAASGWSSALITGTFSVPLIVKADKPGGFLLCAWTVNPTPEITTLLTQQSVIVRRLAKARIARKSVKRGGRLRAQISHANGFASFQFSQKGTVVRTVKARIFQGKASVSTSRFRLGTYRLAIEAAGQKVLLTTVRVVR